MELLLFQKKIACTVTLKRFSQPFVCKNMLCEFKFSTENIFLYKDSLRKPKYFCLNYCPRLNFDAVAYQVTVYKRNYFFTKIVLLKKMPESD